MGETASAAASLCCRSPAIFGGRGNCGGGLNSKKAWTLRTQAPMAKLKMNAHHHHPPSPASSSSPSGMNTFTSTVSTDIPLYEPNGVSFDEYLADRHRIFRAMFPDKHRSEQLNDEEWRIQMRPLQFLFASVSPVVVMRLRCKSGGKEYPPAVPVHVPRVLELQAVQNPSMAPSAFELLGLLLAVWVALCLQTRWELRGLDAAHMPSHFSLNVQGLLYSERKCGRQSRLKGSLNLSISMVLTPVLRLVPEDVLRSTVELVLQGLLEKMKDEVHGDLLQDFQRFGREKLMKLGTLTQPSVTAAAAAKQRDLPASPPS